VKWLRIDARGHEDDRSSDLTRRPANISLRNSKSGHPDAMIGTHLPGRVRNVSLAPSNGLMPLFEAVSNSIHAIEEAGLHPDDGRIEISIQRSSPTLLSDLDESPVQGEIDGFVVVDNGVGFNESNFTSFQTLDSEYKVERGGRGVGRLLWLKAFEAVSIDSVFKDADGTYKHRAFTFNAATGVVGAAPEVVDGLTQRRTAISLTGYRARYRQQSYKTANAIAAAIVEHCLWYFVRPGGTAKILVYDGNLIIRLDEVYEDLMHASAVQERLSIKEETLDLLHVKLRAKSNASHIVAYCADDRVVTTEKLAGKIPGVHGRLNDQNGDFVYACYVSSPTLDQAARPERSSFELAEDAGDLFRNSEVGFDDIRRAVREAASAHLAPQIEEARQQVTKRVQTYANHNAPRYRPVLSRISVDDLGLDPHVSDKELELALHRQLAEIERQMISEGHNLLTPQHAESAEAYTRRIAEYLKTVEDIKMSDLANYVTHRRVIIELLKEAIKRKPDGGYHREDLIHTLIMPMVADSTEVLLDSCNLWLIDERLAFHHYLASDKPISAMPITGSTSTTEPDLIALNVFDNPMMVTESATPPYATITVVELKKPMRTGGSGEKDDPVQQALNYLHRVRSGRVTTVDGRPIPNAGTIPGFCYVICDISEFVRERCLISHDLDVTSDGMGFFGYKKHLNAYVEVTSYDRLVRAAVERNRAFFDKLGLPVS
jgi:hypothetical protein